MHGSISTCYHAPPGHTPGDLQFCSPLVVYSPPPGTQKETIPHPRDGRAGLVPGVARGGGGGMVTGKIEPCITQTIPLPPPADFTGGPHNLFDSKFEGFVWECYEVRF